MTYYKRLKARVMDALERSYALFVEKAQTREVIAQNNLSASIELAKLDIGFVPYTTAATSPSMLLHILNEVTVNSRAAILELGTGISTLYLDALCQEKRLSCQVITVDDSRAQQSLKDQMLPIRAKCTKVVFYALATNEAEGWQNSAFSNLAKSKRLKFDCITVGADRFENLRAGLAFLLKNDLLSKEFIIFVADTHEIGRQSLTKEWQRLLNCRKTDYETYSTLAIGIGGQSEPFYQSYDSKTKQARQRIVFNRSRETCKGSLPRRKATKNKVFCIGLGKTGTTTLGEALKILGYEHQGFSERLVRAFGAGNLDFLRRTSKIKDSFDDFPWPLVYREFSEIYPSAKFILTERSSVEVWWRSLLRHADRTGPTSAKKIAYGFSLPHGHEEHHKNLYANHNTEVKEFFKDKPGRLLTVCWELGHGWAELCEFLGLQEPNAQFPFLNRDPFSNGHL